MFKCLMVYCNTPLSSSLQSQMQILSSRSARLDLPMSSKARKQLGLDCDNLRNKNKNEHLPLHDLHIDQEVMYQDSKSKQWYPATITRLCKDPRSYIITTKKGVQYSKTQTHSKPYQPQAENSEDEHLLQSNHMWTVKSETKKPHNIDHLVQSRPKRDIKPILNWIYKEQCDYLAIRLYIT